MRYKQTQVYLSPEQHARLKADAARRGISLAELMRQLVAAHVGEQAPAYGEKTWESIVALTDDDTPTDVAGDREALEREAAEALHAKKLGAASKGRRKRAR